MIRLLVLFGLLTWAGESTAASLSGRIFIGSTLLDVLIIAPDTGPGPILSDAITAVPGPSAIGSGGASAFYEASFGRLRARASSAVQAPATLPFGFDFDSGTNGEAGFADIFTINAPGLAGTTGTLRVRLDISGSVTSSASGEDDQFASISNADWLLNLSLGTQEGGFQQRYGGCGMTAGQTADCVLQGSPFGIWTTEEITFTYGTPMELSLALFATTGGRSVEGGSYSASTNLSSTVRWLGLEDVLDANGVPVPAFSVSSDSGTDWALPVPEPAIVGLIALGLTGLGFARSRRARVSG